MREPFARTPETKKSGDTQLSAPKGVLSGSGGIEADTVVGGAIDTDNLMFTAAVPDDTNFCRRVATSPLNRVERTT